MGNAIHQAISMAVVAFLLGNQVLSYSGQEKSPDRAQSRQDSAKQDPPGEKTEKDSMETELRLRARYLAETVAASKDLEDKLESSHMKADFAALLCESGDSARSIEVLKNSFEELLNGSLARKPGSEDDSEASDISEQAVHIAETATKCDPASRSWFVEKLARLQSDESDGKDKSASTMEPPVVSDQLWGSKPSLRRQVAADFLARAAHQKLDQDKGEEAQKLLEESLSYCVVFAFISGLIKLRESRPAAILNLYTLAARKVQALPSGSELSDLSYGLNPLFGISLNPTLFSPLKAESNRVATENYMEAVTALTLSPYSNLAGQSPDTLRMIKAALPLYSLFRISMKPQIEAWVAEAANHLPAGERAVVETVPFVAAPPAQRAASIEEIAANSTDPKQRDEAYASLASVSIQRKKFENAMEIAWKISDVPLRREVLDDAYFFRLYLQIGATSELNAFFHLLQDIESISSITLRVRAYTLFGQAAYKNKVSLALESLQEASRLASKMESSPTKSHLLLAIARAYGDFDLVRMRETLSDAIKSINSNKEQPRSRWGRATTETSTVKYDKTWTLPRFVIDDPQQYKKPYNLSAFASLVRADFEGARMLADQLLDKSLRASALFETCAGILRNPRQDTKERNSSVSTSAKPVER